MKFVPVKKPEQQGILALHSARSLLVRQQTMLVNGMRSLATEFGLIVPKGIGKLGELMTLVDQDEAFPTTARRVFTSLLDQCNALAETIEAFEAEIVAHARNDETARRLATIPGIGPVTASLITATVTDISLFRSARHFAAWLGLVPPQYSTGGKNRLGRITKTGNRDIRRSLVLGATSMVYRAPHWNSADGARLWFSNAHVESPIGNARRAWHGRAAAPSWSRLRFHR
jgi:transposase